MPLAHRVSHLEIARNFDQKGLFVYGLFNIPCLSYRLPCPRATTTTSVHNSLSHTAIIMDRRSSIWTFTIGWRSSYGGSLAIPET